MPAGCPRFAVAARPHVVARWFFLSAGSVATAARLAHQSRFLASGHPERGDAPSVRAAVARAAVQMEARVREESEYERYERGRPDMSRSVANRGCSDGANEEAFFARKSDERGEKRRATLKEDEGADRRVDAPGAGGGHEDRPGGGKRAAARDPIGSSFGRKTPSSMNPVVA